MRGSHAVALFAVVAGGAFSVGCGSRAAPAPEGSTSPRVPASDAAPAATGAAATAAPASAIVAPEAALPEPPPDKDEEPSAPPSPNSRWYPGFWHWIATRRTYAWYAGFWHERDFVAPQAPPPLRHEVEGRPPGDGYMYAPGYWRWSGREYAWVPGHYLPWPVPRSFAGPRWEETDGHWAWRDEGWAHRQEAWEVARKERRHEGVEPSGRGRSEPNARARAPSDTGSPAP